LIPILSNLKNLSVRIEGDDVDLLDMVSASRLEARRGAYDWESNNAISEEVIIQAWQICATSCEKLYRGVNLNCKSISTFNNIQEFLLLLLELATLACKVFGNFGRAIERDESCNVMEGRVVGEERGVWSN